MLPSLLLFARAPEPGRVKTRLSAALSARGAADLYRAFLEDASRAYGSRAAWTSILCADPGPEDPLLASVFPAPWLRRAQGDGDLGERLRRAFEDELGAGAPSVVAVGGDHPALPARRLEEAFESLAAGDAAVVPAEDGGDCAIGLSAGAPVAEVFREIPWSTSAVLSTTLQRMEKAGLRCRRLEPAYDVDRPEDLERLRRDLSGRDPGDADFPSATAGALAALARRHG
jgi:rSAM/selenodomain-associated transferase 1